MGQLQRDDRRRSRQKTVELWEIEQERTRPSRSRQRRPVEQSRQRRPTEQSRQRRLAEQSRQRRPIQQPEQRRQPGNPRPVQSIKRRKARRRKIFLSCAVTALFILLCLMLIYQTAGAVYRYIHRDMIHDTADKKEGSRDVISNKIKGKKVTPPEYLVDYIDINEYSRPGTKLKKVDSVFVHYTANVRTSAQNNRSYFANLAETHERAASAHFIIGYEGEMILCIPLDEQDYGVKTRNEDSISIECCYLSEDGSFTPETYETLVHTLAWLLEEYDLTTKDILRHYDCGGKKCPLYYVEHEDAWERLLADVEAYEET